MQLRELKEIDGELKQIMLVIIICISRSRDYTEDQVRYRQESHPALEKNLLAYVLVPHYAKV